MITMTMTVIKEKTRGIFVATLVIRCLKTPSILPMEAVAGRVTVDTESLVAHVSVKPMTTVVSANTIQAIVATHATPSHRMPTTQPMEAVAGRVTVDTENLAMSVYEIMMTTTTIVL